MSGDSIRITVGSVQIDLRSDGNTKVRKVVVPAESVTTIDGRMFIKLQRADNVTRRLIGHKCFASNPDIVQQVLRRTDVVKQILKEQGLLDNKKYASVLNDIQDKK